jgi:hypothetical protein
MSTPPGTFTAQTIEPGPAERPGASHNPALREPIATDPSASRESRNDDVAEEHETAVGIGMRPVLGEIVSPRKSLVVASKVSLKVTKPASRERMVPFGSFSFS